MGTGLLRMVRLCHHQPVTGTASMWILYSRDTCVMLAPLLPQVMEAAGKHQVLIFVHSRKETAKTAR